MNRNLIKKLILYGSIALNVILVSIFTYKIYHNWFEGTVLKSAFRNSFFDVAAKESGKIYFLGDSHTEAFELNELLHNTDVRNRGIWGDNSEGVLKRIDNIIQAHPSKVFIMIGVNDIGMGKSVRYVATNVEKTVKRIKDAVPGAKIYIESVLPTNQIIFHSNESSLPKIKELNAAYKNIAQKHDVGYIDLYQTFEGKDGLKQEYSFDGLHLNGTGYIMLASLLKKYVD